MSTGIFGPIRKISVPFAELEFTYARSSGPGGQNVNKVNSKAVLRWNLRDSTAIPLEVKNRFLQAYGAKVNQDGELILTSDIYRDQIRNKEDCIERLNEMLQAVAVPPKKRKKTKPSKSSQRKRIESKKRQSDKKSFRQKY